MKNSSAKESPWWACGCQHLWHGLLWMGGVLIVGVGINVGLAWLTTATFSLAKTPLGWLLDHPVLPFATGGSLLALTASTGGVTARHYRSSSSSSLPVEQQNRQRSLAKLQSRSANLFTQSLQGAIQIALTFHSSPTAVKNKPIRLNSG